MNRNRIIFYIVFGTFHLGAFIFTIMLNNDTGLLFKMVGYVPMFKWVTFVGLLMLLVDAGWAFVTKRNALKEKAALTQELNTLKAKLFDLQEAAKKQAAAAAQKEAGK
ncbi:MAG: hypothetical protein EBR30_23775 [Cytophagia bacterium]|jgi:hypothetical protein|nr:hypothetical protein [Cytophagia bacterium]NBW37982.1 hypothetical protein [Cytophagia bacterium]